MDKLLDPLAGPVLRNFVQYLIAFCSRSEAASDVISGALVKPTVPGKHVQFRGHRSNHTREIPPEGILGKKIDSNY